MTTSRRLRRLSIVMPLLAGVVMAVPAVGASDTQTGTKTYSSPFRAGPQGGDSFSYHSADPSGTVTVGRAYPVPGAINCTKGGPYAKLVVVHHATAPIRRVVISYTNAAVDNFTFILVGLRNQHGRWYGTETVRGVVTGSGSVTLRPDRQSGPFPRTLVVEFGLQQSSACPNVDFGTVQFTKVQVVQ
jgi:hypothetical protein